MKLTLEDHHKGKFWFKTEYRGAWSVITREDRVWRVWSMIYFNKKNFFSYIKKYESGHIEKRKPIQTLIQSDEVLKAIVPHTQKKKKKKKKEREKSTLLS